MRETPLDCMNASNNDDRKSITGLLLSRNDEYDGKEEDKGDD